MHHLFYLFGTIYFGIFATIAYLLADDTYGLSNTITSEDRYLGWISYCAIESFGSVMVSSYFSSWRNK